MQQGMVSKMLQQQADLTRTQNEIATGRKLITPADDPGGAIRAIDLQRALTANEQFASNASLVTSRLSFEEQALADAGNLLQRVRELTLQANNSVLGDSSRSMINTEIRTRVQELMDIANRQDASGEYLFSGSKTTTSPFGRTVTGVSYYGDSTGRMVQVSATQQVQDAHAGFETFVDVPNGNGTFTTAAGVANSGAGVIDTGSVTNPAAWVPGTYRVIFTAPGTYDVRDAGNNPVVSGNYVSGGAIDFLGARVSVTGTPATGDTFTVAPSTREDIFTTLDRLVATLSSSTQSASQAAQFSTTMGGVIQQLSQGMDHLLNVRASVGARLSAVESASSAREDLNIEMQKSLGEIRDVDYATVMTRMNSQMVALQAAQQSYAATSRLSLFDYL
jgi:flagellar hook-associated protein 3 FlgL